MLQSLLRRRIEASVLQSLLLICAVAAQPPPPPSSPVCLSPGNCISADPNDVKVFALSPPGGPIEGRTRVVVIGHGFRNFGALMKCRFGSQLTSASLTAPPGGYIDPYNHTMVACEAPRSPTPLEQTVGVEVTLNGDEYTGGGKTFHYYRHPQLTGVSPARGSASKPQTLTVSRSTSIASGGWGLPTAAAGEASRYQRCRFEAVVQVDGKRQVPFKQEVNATVVDETELLCRTPVVSFVAPVRVEVTLNGQQYGSGGPVFTYEDNWHSPAQSGEPPSGRHGMGYARVGDTLYFYGGEDGHLDGNGGFLGDMHALHLDAMSDFYPSETAYDLTWQTLSLSTGGDLPSPRSYHSLAAWATTLILFGGMASMFGEMHNSTHEYSTSRAVWQQVAVSGGPVAPRSAHSAVVCSLAVGCSTSDGRAAMFVFGGWGMQPCGASQPCLVHRSDLLALDLNTMHWSAVPINAEQPTPPARKGHSATLLNSSMLVFGGSAWVPESDADNSYGHTTRHVNDLWQIDLSGADAYTWRPVHSVGDRPTPREGHTACLLAQRYLVVQGGHGPEPRAPRPKPRCAPPLRPPLTAPPPCMPQVRPRGRLPQRHARARHAGGSDGVEPPHADGQTAQLAPRPRRDGPRRRGPRDHDLRRL